MCTIHTYFQIFTVTEYTLTDFLLSPENHVSWKTVSEETTQCNEN